MKAHAKLSWVLVLALAAVGCSGVQEIGDPGGPSGPPPGGRAAELADLDGKPLEKCRSVRFVRTACPESVPKTERPYMGRSIPFGNPRFRTFELASSAPYEGLPRRNRPPRFAHVVIEAGELAQRFEFAWPPSHSDREPAELLATHRTKPVLLEEPVWGERRGMLVLMPSFETGGIHGDHLLFQWRDGGVDYVLSLHAWAPFEEARATVQVMVEELPHT